MEALAAELRDMNGRMARIETRMMRGFDELGVDVKTKPGWLVVDEAKKTITITSLHHTLATITKELQARGVVFGEGKYRLVFEGRPVCFL